MHVLLPLPNRSTFILIIDADEAWREIQQRNLELQVFTVLTAGDGNIGLELAQTFFPNLILLDLDLPGMSGLTILEKLQANYLTSSIPVIITLVSEKLPQIEKGFVTTIIDYLVKPYGMNELTIRINHG